MDVPYDQVASQAFASGSVPNGYFGDRVRVKFSLVGDIVVVVAWCGYFRAGLPPVVDTAEALWMLEHHPAARHVIVDGRERQ